MNAPNSRLLDASPFDETVDSRPRLPADCGCPKVAMVEGSGPQLRTVTTSLLRGRLRAAALALFFGFFVFLLRPYFAESGLQPSLPALDLFHMLVVLVLAGYGTMLCTRCDVSLGKLRLAELLIFGLPGAYFVFLTYVGLHLCLEEQYQAGIVAVIHRLAICALVLMFTYCLFIPNTWRRAAVVVAAMTVAPIIMISIATYRHALVYEAITTDGLVVIFLMLVISGIVSVYGTHMIGTLRRDAFEAQQLGQYRLRRRLGAGGMGEVYLAEHLMLKRPCAIKLIQPSQANDPKAMARFEREVQATARLTHWNTVEIFDYGHTDEGTFYYVMEYLPGRSLAELVDDHGPMAVERVVHLLTQTCHALREAHQAGLIHRDIKPGNIFAAQRGGVYDVAKLLDFGLVKPMLEKDDSTQLTVDGSITGSPLYMSPEQAMGTQDADARSDIYSLGAVAYYLLTGSPPFVADKALQVLVAHAHKPVTPPTQLRAEIPADLEQIVLRCLAKAPEDRFQSVDELARALEQCDLPQRWTDERAAAWWQGQPSESPQVEIAGATI